MAFRRFRRSSMQPVNSIKHIIDTSGGLTSANSVNEIAKGVPAQDPVNFAPNEVIFGSKINAFFLSIFVIGDSSAALSGPIDWYLIKKEAGQTSVLTPGNTGTSNFRNQIIHEEKGISGSGDGTPMVFKGVIVIPRGMRRMREGSLWQIVLKCNGADTCNFCIKAIYKSFR